MLGFSPLGAVPLGIGEVWIAPGLFTNEQAFIEPLVSSGEAIVAPPLLVNGAAFYAPTISSTLDLNLVAPLIQSQPLIYAPTLSYGVYSLSAPVISATGGVYPPVVQVGAARLYPLLFENEQAFFVATLALGEPLIINVPEDSIVRTPMRANTVVTPGRSNMVVTPGLSNIIRAT